MTSSILGQDVTTGNLVSLSQTARLNGLYLIGGTGTGKSTLIENLIIQDIEQGLGVELLDPHGDVTLSVLSQLPYYREKDVILLNIVDTEYPFGLNLFTCSDLTNPFEVQKTLDQVMHVFEKLFGVNHSTPLLAEYLRNCTYTILANPGYTLVDIPLLLMDEGTRSKLVSNVTNPQVRLFWDYYNSLKPSEQHDQSASILNRVDEFTYPIIRNIVGQSRTTIDFKHVMDRGKILLLKLDARLEVATSLIGSLLVAQILNAAYARQTKKQFHLYADEFQRFATEDFVTLLEEARKFGIGMTIAHQFREQLDRQTRIATINQANLVAFRLSGKDAVELAKAFETESFQATQTEIAARLLALPDNSAWVKIVEEGNVVEHTIKTLEPAKGLYGKALQERINRIQVQNRADGYTRPRQEVEEEIRQRQEEYLEGQTSGSSHARMHNWHEAMEGSSYQETKHVVEGTITALDEAEVPHITIRIRITEEPLTARNLATIISALTKLYTKCWLIQQGRFDDLVEYAQTYNLQFDEEAHLGIAKISYNSPALIDFLISSASIASATTLALALKIGIDAVAGWRERQRRVTIQNDALDQKIEQAKREADVLLDDKKQDKQIKAGEAYIKQQNDLIELERNRLKLQQEQLEFAVKRIERALETAQKMVDVLNPQADTNTKAIVSRTLINNMLELYEGKHVELLTAPEQGINGIAKDL